MFITRERVRQVETKGKDNFITNGKSMKIFDEDEVSDGFLSILLKGKYERS